MDNHQNVSGVLTTITRVSQRILIKHTITWSAQVMKPLDVTVNTTGTLHCNTMLV